MKRMWLLVVVIFASLAPAQSIYKVSIASPTSWPQWKFIAPPHSYRRVTPARGTIELDGEGPGFWKKNHVHGIWQTTDGTNSAEMSFTWAEPMKTSYIDSYCDQDVRVGRDCLWHALDYAPYVADSMVCLTVHDTGPEWVAMCAGDFWLAMGYQFTPVPLHERYIEAGLFQRTADGVIHLLSYQLIPGDFPVSQGDPSHYHQLTVTSVSRLAVGTYRTPAGDIFSLNADLPEPDQALGRVGVVAVVTPRHLCMFNESSWHWDFAWIIAQ